MREFLHVDDLAEAIKFALESKLQQALYNVGTGEDLSIKSLAEITKSIIGHQGLVDWDRSKPDGTPRKLMNSNRILSSGWKPKISLFDGISSVYKWYLKHNV